MIGNRPKYRRFHQRLLSRKQHTAGKQITLGQLIEKQIIMTISKAMIMYIGITSKISRPTLACIYYYYSTHDCYPACFQCIKFLEKRSNAIKTLTLCRQDLFMQELTPHFYPRWQQYNTCLVVPIVTGKGHRKIEPITKHLFPWQEKSIQLAKPNQSFGEEIRGYNNHA